jgi:hypothetical protein
LSSGLTTSSAIWRQRSAFARYSSVLFVTDSPHTGQCRMMHFVPNGPGPFFAARCVGSPARW